MIIQALLRTMKNVFVLLMLLSCSSLPMPGYAALIEMDYLTPGDGLITRDTQSGLEWLDITQTFGLTFDEILQGTGNSWYADGWRFATTDEVSAMIYNYAGVLVGCEGCPSYAAIPEGTANAIIGLFGANPNGWVNAYFDDGPESEHVGQFAVSFNQTLSQYIVAVEAPNGIARTVSSPELGSALVRPVPLPNSIWLLLSGALWMFRYGQKNIRGMKSCMNLGS